MCKFWLTLLEISITCCYLFYFLFFLPATTFDGRSFHFPLKNLCTSKRKQTVFCCCCICMKKRWKKKQQNAKSQKNVYSNCLKFILCHLLTNIYVFLFYINVFVFVLFYCRALLGGAAQFIGMRAYNLYKIRNDFFASVSIYVRYIWLRTEVAARSTHRHTHTQAGTRTRTLYTHKQHKEQS